MCVCVSQCEGGRGVCLWPSPSDGHPSSINSYSSIKGRWRPGLEMKHVPPESVEIGD